MSEPRQIDSAPQEVPAPPYYQAQPYPPVPIPPMQTLPGHPLHPRRGTDMFDVADFSSNAGAKGLQRGAITGLLREIQTAAMNVSLDVMPKVMDAVHAASQARVNQLGQRINRLRRVALPTTVAPPASMWDALRGRGNTQYVSETDEYVRLADVIALVNEALIESPST